MAVAPVQPAAQLKPLGVLVTLPVPLPVLLKVTTRVLVAALKLAVTLLAASMVTVHEPVPVQAPDQPAKVLPAAACAVKVTGVLAAKLAEHVLPQLIPAGLLVTVPLPAPWRETDRV